MSKIRFIALVVAIIGVSAAAFTTQASACPGGYVPCGPGCCPGRWRL